jgi:putative aldouronate transport system permease protein
LEIVTNKAITEKKVTRSQTTFRKMKKHWQFYLIIIPPMLYIIIFKYLPLFGLQIAFRDFNVVGGIWGSPWVGFDQFTRFFDSPQFWSILGNTLKISIVTLIFTFPAPIILALLLNEVRVGIFKKISQTISFAPHFISVVVMAGMILLFLDPNNGILPKLLHFFGVEPINYLASITGFKYVYALSEVWQHTGYSSILYLAALAGVNPELYEAAKVDGASKLQKIINVDIPGILPAITILLILAIGELTSVGFEKILLLQNPVNLPGSQVIPTYVYQIGLINDSYSYATAIGIFNSVINFALLFVVNWIARKTSENSLW